MAGIRILRLLVLAAGLLVFLGSPAALLAQENRVDLSLRLLSGYYYSEVTPGEDNTLYAEVRNNGNRVITNIIFDSDNPEGWTVDFEPGSIEFLGVNSHQTVDVNVIPPRDSSSGDYNLTFLAEADQTRTATSVRLRVEDGFSFWMWVGIGVAVLVFVGFVFVFRRFGRG